MDRPLMVDFKKNSDIDLLVITNTSFPIALRKKLGSSFLNISGEIGNKKSIRPLEITIVNINALIPSVPDNDIRNATLDSLSLLLQGMDGDESNTILTPARMYFPLVNGTIRSKHEAAVWLIKELPNEFHNLVGQAGSAYLGKYADWKDKENELRRFASLWL